MKQLLDYIWGGKTHSQPKKTVFWVVAPCSLVEIHQSFRGARCLHHHGDESLIATRRKNPEDSHLHTRSRQNLKSRFHNSFIMPSYREMTRPHFRLLIVYYYYYYLFLLQLGLHPVAVVLTLHNYNKKKHTISTTKNIQRASTRYWGGGLQRY
jgi:hypothetical protein